MLLGMHLCSDKNWSTGYSIVYRLHDFLIIWLFLYCRFLFSYVSTCLHLFDLAMSAIGKITMWSKK